MSAFFDDTLRATRFLRSKGYNHEEKFKFFKVAELLAEFKASEANADKSNFNTHSNHVHSKNP